jgi:protein tyrosine/serine phosphatase
VDDNFRVVDEGVFYRSGQMSATRLAQVIRLYDIQTVINLRGAEENEEWYESEVSLCEDLGVAHHDFFWRKKLLPDPGSLVAYLDLVQRAPQPILVHCQGGAHRSGLGSAVYVLLQGQDPDQARRQFHRFARGSTIEQVLHLYNGSPLPFATWARDVYPALYADGAAPTATR